MAMKYLSDIQLSRDPIATLDAATKQYVDSKVSKSGDIMSGDLTISHAGLTQLIAKSIDGPTYIVARATSGQPAVVLFTNTAEVPRWAFGKGSGAESGSNSGSDFSFIRFNDSGNIVSEPLQLIRSSGNIKMNGVLDMSNLKIMNTADPTANTDVANKQYVDSKTGGLTVTYTPDSTGWWRIAHILPVTGSSPSGGGNGAATFRIYTNAGSKHDYIELLVSHSYGKSTLDIVRANAYGAAPAISQVRLIEGATYDGCAVEVNVATVASFITEMEQATSYSPGFTMLSPWTKTTSIPSGMAEQHLYGTQVAWLTSSQTQAAMWFNQDGDFMVRGSDMSSRVVMNNTAETFLKKIVINDSLSDQLNMSGGTKSALFRVDSSDFYFMVSDTVSGSFNALRPMRVRLSDGKLFFTDLYNQGSASGSVVVVQSDGSLWKSTSSVRGKHDIIGLDGTTPALIPYDRRLKHQSTIPDAHAVLDITPVQYVADGLHDGFITRVGVIAEDVAEVFPFGVVEDATAIDWPAINSALLQVVRDQQQQINDLTTRTVELERYVILPTEE